MNNSLISQIKRGLKVTTSYIFAMILFAVFALPVFSIAKDNIETAMFYFSILIFLLMFFSIYVEMRTLAFKEKRPQYNINPSPFKGFLYGAIGALPLVLLQIIVLLIQVPDDYVLLMRKVYQGLCAPLYWFASLIGDLSYHYVISFVLIIIIAGLGYYAGYKDFYIVEPLRKKLGIKKSAQKK